MTTPYFFFFFYGCNVRLKCNILQKILCYWNSLVLATVGTPHNNISPKLFCLDLLLHFFFYCSSKKYFICWTRNKHTVEWERVHSILSIHCCLHNVRRVWKKKEKKSIIFWFANAGQRATWCRSNQLLSHSEHCSTAKLCCNKTLENVCRFFFLFLFLLSSYYVTTSM